MEFLILLAIGVMVCGAVAGFCTAVVFRRQHVSSATRRLLVYTFTLASLVAVISGLGYYHFLQTLNWG